MLNNNSVMIVGTRHGNVIFVISCHFVAPSSLEPAVLAARAGERGRPSSIGATKWMWVALGDWVEGCLSHLARCAVFVRLRALIIGKKRERRA